MHQKNREVLNVLKLIKAEFLKKQTEPGRKSKELTEEEQIKVLIKMSNQREDSIKAYTNAGRQDLADSEKKELEILEDFIPKSPSEEEVVKISLEAIDEYLQTKDEGYKLSIKDMKPVLSIVKGKNPLVSPKYLSEILLGKSKK